MRAYSLRREKAGIEQLADLEGIADEIEGIACGHTVLAVGAQMVGDDAAVARHAARRGTPGAHGDEIERQITRADAVDIDEAEHVLEIGRNAKGYVKGTKPVIDTLAAVERRMRRLIAHAHHPAVEEARRIVAHACCEVGVIHKMDVAIHGIHAVIGQRHGNLAQHTLRGVEIV